MKVWVVIVLKNYQIDRDMTVWTGQGASVFSEEAAARQAGVKLVEAGWTFADCVCVEVDDATVFPPLPFEKTRAVDHCQSASISPPPPHRP